MEVILQVSNINFNEVARYSSNLAVYIALWCAFGNILTMENYLSTSCWHRGTDVIYFHRQQGLYSLRAGTGGYANHGGRHRHVPDLVRVNLRQAWLAAINRVSMVPAGQGSPAPLMPVVP